MGRLALIATTAAAATLSGCALQDPQALLRHGERSAWSVSGPVPVREFVRCLAARIESEDYPAVLVSGLATGAPPAVRIIALREGGWELRSIGAQANLLVRVQPTAQGYDLAVYSNTLPGVPHYAALVEVAAPACATIGHDVVLPRVETPPVLRQPMP